MSDFSDVIVKMEQINKRQEEQLRRLCEGAEPYAIATALTDALVGNLLYLCNFEVATNVDGKHMPMDQVYRRLLQDIEATFFKLTGKRYVPPVVRHSENKHE